jgi:hypothetical protein
MEGGLIATQQAKKYGVKNFRYFSTLENMLRWVEKKFAEAHQV